MVNKTSAELIERPVARIVSNRENINLHFVDALFFCYHVF